MKMRLEVDGLTDVLKALADYPEQVRPLMQANLLKVAEKVAAATARKFSSEHSRTSRIVVDDETGKERRRPVKQTGEHIGSITVKPSGKSNVVIQAGTRSGAGQGFGWLDFGGSMRPKGRRLWDSRRPVEKTGRYLYPTGYAHNAEMTRAMESAADAVTRRLNLD